MIVSLQLLIISTDPLTELFIKNSHLYVIYYYNTTKFLTIYMVNLS